jgi:hypothetical protein
MGVGILCLTYLLQAGDAPGWPVETGPPGQGGRRTQKAPGGEDQPVWRQLSTGQIAAVWQ